MHWFTSFKTFIYNNYNNYSHNWDVFSIRAKSLPNMNRKTWVFILSLNKLTEWLVFGSGLVRYIFSVSNDGNVLSKDMLSSGINECMLSSINYEKWLLL